MCCVLLGAPAVASADMTVSSSANSNVTVTGGCDFTANSSSSNVNITALANCLNASTPSTLTDALTGGGAVDLNATLTASSCNSTELTVANSSSEGGISINAPVNLGTNGCSFYPEALSGGDITQASSSAAITVSGLFPQLSGNGALTLSGAGNEIQAFGADTAGGNTVLDDSEALLIDTINGSTGEIGVNVPDGITLAGTINSDAYTSLDASSGPVSEASAGATITTPELGVLATGAVSLNSANNVAQLVSLDGTDPLSFVDQPTNGLDLLTVSTSGDLSIQTSGNLTVTQPVTTASGHTVSLTSTTGSILESGAGVVTAPTLDLSAPDGGAAMSSANQAGTLEALTGAGGLDFQAADTSSVTLGAVSAGGVLTVADPSEPIDVSGTVAGASVNLTGSGFSGAGGKISAPTVAITDTVADAWTVAAGSLTDGSNAAIPFSGASALSITGHDTFNVTASPSTTFTFDGGSPAAGTLNYNAQGRTVSGSTAVPTGAIDSSAVDPVDFSGMKAVNLSDVGTASGVTSPAPGATSPAPTSCTLTARSSKVSVPKRAEKRRRKTLATLTLYASCSAAAAVSLSGKVRVTTKARGKGKRTRSKSYLIKVVKASLSAGSKTKFVIDLPAAAVTALTRHDAESASFTLSRTGTGANANAAALNLKRLT